MAVMPFSHDFPDFARNLRERREQSAVFALELFRPPVGGRVQRRMPEHQRRVTLFRIIGTGYGVQVLPRERLLPPVRIRERPGAGNLNPFFVVHANTSLNCSGSRDRGSCPIHPIPEQLGKNRSRKCPQVLTTSLFEPF